MLLTAQPDAGATCLHASLLHEDFGHPVLPQLAA